jgi:hypothetical protein
MTEKKKLGVDAIVLSPTQLDALGSARAEHLDQAIAVKVETTNLHEGTTVALTAVTLRNPSQPAVQRQRRLVVLVTKTGKVSVMHP